MDADHKNMFLLPRETMESQLSMIELIQAMFPEPDKVEISTSTSQTIVQLNEWCSSDSEIMEMTVPFELPFTVHLSIESEGHHWIELNISVPLRSPTEFPPEPPALKYVLRQPSWINKAEVADMASNMPPDDIFAAFDYIREEGPEVLRKKASLLLVPSDSKVAASPDIRVWFYFPSLSTRSKRDDLVNNAARYGLTGFVLAGKPGLLCLEGQSAQIDAYMKYIKTESWGDIPSYQKKVSERFREEAEGQGVERKFVGMEEITDVLGERGGERANRSDMKALEIWLKDRGVGDAFEKIIF